MNTHRSLFSIDTYVKKHVLGAGKYQLVNLSFKRIYLDKRLVAALNGGVLHDYSKNKCTLFVILLKMKFPIALMYLVAINF